MANNKDVKRGIVLYLDGKEVENNAKNIQREMRKVRKEIDGCTFGSKEYIDATKRYRELNSILNEHKAKLREVKTEHFNFINTINNLWQKWQLTIGSFMAAFAGVSLALSKFRKEMNADEESAANLKALTGLDDNSIAWLEDQAKYLSTTMDETGLRIQKSTKEILEAYMLVGSAKPELLQDKEALNAVTIEALRLSEAAKMDMKAAVDGVTLSLNQYGASANEASRYVNVLAAGSKFGAANVENQTAAITKAGVAASVANVPIESLVGSIETLAEKGIKGEVAGTGLKTFFLKLEGMADDVRPSVVGLETALENLRKKNLSTAETQKMFGLEAYTVAQAMISGADKVREYTAAVTDTNTAIEQAAINSDTANAKLAQMKNEFNEQGKILVKELNPAITKLVSLGMNSTRILVNITRFMTEHRITLVATTVALSAYIALRNAEVVADKLSVFWTDKLKVSLKSLYVTMRANPWGVALTLITAVTAAIVEYNFSLSKSISNETKISKLRKKAQQDYESEKRNISALTSIVEDNTSSIFRRRKALNKLLEIVPGYHASLTEEGRLINHNREQLEQYISTLEQEIKVKAFEDAIADAVKRREQAIKELNSYAEETGTVLPEGGSRSLGNKALEWFENFIWGVKGGNKKELPIADAARRYANAISDIRSLETEMKKLESDIASNSFVGDAGSGDGGSGTGSTSTSTSSPAVDRIKQESQAIELEIAYRRNLLRQSRIEDKISEEKYNNDLIKLETERLDRILGIAGLEPEKVADIQGRLQEILLKAKQDVENVGIPEAATEELRAYRQALDKIEQETRESISKLDLALSLGALKQEDYNERVNEVWKKYENDRKLALDTYNEALQELLKKEDEALEDHEKKLKEKAELYTDIGKQIGEALGSSIAEAIDRSRGQLREAFKGVLKIILDSIEKMMVAAVAQRTISNVAQLGFWGIAKAAGEIALITAAFEAAKGVISNWGDSGYSTGGYTGIGGAYEPAGIVHKGEFVANRYALANPAVRSVLDLIDTAQRAGTIANLTAEDIASVGRSRYSQSSQPTVITQSDPALLAMLKATSKTLQQVNERFSKPIYARTYVLGHGGIKEAEESAGKLMNNISR